MYVFFPWKHFDVRFWQKKDAGVWIYSSQLHAKDSWQCSSNSGIRPNGRKKVGGSNFQESLVAKSDILSLKKKKSASESNQACHARWQLAKQHITHAEVPVEIAFASHINQMLPYSVYLRSHLPCWSALEKGTQGGLVRVLAALSTWFA